MTTSKKATPGKDTLKKGKTQPKRAPHGLTFAQAHPAIRQGGAVLRRAVDEPNSKDARREQG